ncbi:MAG: hypothetical protein SFY66_05280 [Oculatellaceae cyanobacterium bins.114]|nr:hypothetical protein [Oculatellaceae cyanobacterium bins.114]
MPKVLTSNFFWLFYTACLVSFAFTLFFGWGLMVGTLFLIFWVFRCTGMEAKLSDRERRLYWLALLFYPPIETSVQWLGRQGMIPNDFNWVNRLEHGCWAAVLSILFLPIISDVWKRLTRWQSLLFVVGFVCLLGNLNEFFEFSTRVQPPIDEARFARFYSDTIYDMMMNLIGSVVGFGIYFAFASKDPKLPLKS